MAIIWDASSPDDERDYRDRYNEPGNTRSEPLAKCADCGAINVPLISNPFMRGVRCHSCYRRGLVMGMPAHRKTVA